MSSRVWGRLIFLAALAGSLLTFYAAVRGDTLRCYRMARVLRRHVRARWYGCQAKVGHHRWYDLEDSHVYWGATDADDDREECEPEKLCRLYFPPPDG